MRAGTLRERVTIQAADNRSRELWTAILQRDKRPQDITEYAYSRSVDEDTGTPVLVIADRGDGRVSGVKWGVLIAVAVDAGAKWRVRE